MDINFINTISDNLKQNIEKFKTPSSPSNLEIKKPESDEINQKKEEKKEKREY